MNRRTMLLTGVSALISGTAAHLSGATARTTRCLIPPAKPLPFRTDRDVAADKSISESSHCFGAYFPPLERHIHLLAEEIAKGAEAPQGYSREFIIALRSNLRVLNEERLDA